MVHTAKKKKEMLVINGRRMRMDFPLVIIYILLGIMGFSCLLPLINMVAISFSDASAVNAGAVALWPIKPTLAAYEHLVKEGVFFNSFFISVKRVILRVPLCLFMQIMMAFPLSRSEKHFRIRGKIMIYYIIPLLFGGGLIPSFLINKTLGFYNNFWVLIIPGCLDIWGGIQMMNFFRNIPREMDEAAFIDGAGPWALLVRVYLPMSIASIATFTLFCMVGTWNEWFTGVIYFTRVERYPLQTYLNALNLKMQTLSDTSDIEAILARAKLNGMNFNAAKIVLATVPILVVYPLLQRHFTKGIVVGALKE